MFVSMGSGEKEQHEHSGLLEAVANSHIEESTCEEILVQFLKDHKIEKDICPMAGANVPLQRAFLQEHMPNLVEYFSRVYIDVGVVRELCRRWNPTVFLSVPEKKLNHRSLHDILESIAELHFYYRKFLNCCIE